MLDDVLAQERGESHIMVCRLGDRNSNIVKADESAIFKEDYRRFFIRMLNSSDSIVRACAGM